MDKKPILEIRDLRVEIAGSDVIKAADIFLSPARITALVGESGSGKTLTALSVMGLLPPYARITRGRIDYRGIDIISMTEEDKRGMRGDRISMVFQEPFASLNPVMRISEQVDEVLAAHSVMNRRERSVKVLSTFRELGLAEDVLFKYPHELSGGMCQRVLIACSLICDPEVMIMDEPTTALDVTVQQQILGLIERIRSERSPAILFISHDLSVVSRVADDIYVMKKGSVVESGPAEQVLKRPSAPYTRKLMECIPRLGDKRRRLPE